MLLHDSFGLGKVPGVESEYNALYSEPPNLIGEAFSMLRNVLTMMTTIHIHIKFRDSP